MEKPEDSSKAHCRELLIHRMLLAIGLSLIVHFILLSSVILLTNLSITHPLLWIQHTWHILTCLRMWLCFLILSGVVFLQGVITSKDYMNPESLAISRFQKLRLFFKPHNLLVGCLYTTLGGIIAWLHLIVDGGKFGSLIHSCEHLDGYCLVEEHYFLLLQGFWLGLYHFYHHSSSSPIRFPLIPQSKLSLTKRGIKSTLLDACLAALQPTAYSLAFYSLFGAHLRSFIAVPLRLSLEQPPLEKLSRLLNFSLVFYAWLHAVLFLLVTRSTRILLQAYLTEWLAFDLQRSPHLLAKKPQLLLAEALSADLPVVRQLAYLDLLTIAERDPQRRATIFTLSQPGGHPYNWNSVCTKSLQLVRAFCDKIDSACGGGGSIKEQLLPRHQQLQQLQQQQTTASKFETPEKPIIYQMRSLVQSPIPISALPREVVAEAKQAPRPSEESFLAQLRQAAKSYLLSMRPIAWLFAEQPEAKLREALLRDGQTVAWAAEAIAALCAKSIEEDRYGVVQKNLAEIIEVLLRLRAALERAQKTMSGAGAKKYASGDADCRRELQATRAAARRSLYRIVAEFKEYVKDLELTSGAVEQLQPFFNYKE